MSDNSGTGFFENLHLVYKSYGGFRSFIRSGYTWIAFAVSGLTWPRAVDGKWVEVTLPVLPTLAGFSIAAYAIYFSVLNENDRQLLLAPEPTLGNRSPLLILASAVSHTVLVQIMAILLAVIFSARPFPTPVGYGEAAKVVNLCLSFVGLFLTAYGITLVLASVLSIFRVLHIKAKPAPHRGGLSTPLETAADQQQVGKEEAVAPSLTRN